MATFFHFQSLHYLSPHKLFLFHKQPEQHPQLGLHTFEHPSPKHLTICACSIKKSRGNRKSVSNVKLCSDIREFVSAVGLPEDHVPSFKELLEHGRNDLAYIVRRRGYKLIKELLANSTEKNFQGSDTAKCLAEKHDAISNHEDNSRGQGEKAIDGLEDVSLSTEASIMENHTLSSSVDSGLNYGDDSSIPMQSSYNLAFEEKALHKLKGQDETANDMSDENPLSTEVLSLENYSGSSSVVEALNSNDSSCTTTNASVNLSLEEKVSKFIQNGELDTIEDNVYGMLNDSGAKEHKGFIDSENEIESQPKILVKEQLEHVHSDGNAALTVNRSLFPSKQITRPVTATHHVRDNNSSAEGKVGADFDKELDIETSKRENQFEINNLKIMLHQKELELSQLKEQIEKEKLALSVLLAKAETEINKAKKLISEKDAELSAAEESLSGLEEVQIQYCGDGEIVEVTGSFNGWHHRIKMDPQPSTSVVDPIGSRPSRLWSSVLWLYPGVYEIKFIVDGHWKIDPQRESITRCHICNNILRVYG
ncbi:hypothetical protein CFOL_v3_01673 [Cephalotus follicularis]|uniref:AMP-activated protein kinase glycogen-binding domain-containing protein n=1 Tax=Cephalotus follicularis TaxID=3775 RepID=A0A1Q3AQY5_CEPFO|nr:hypothetical protein CFOL_v3_01673 [Cephalotus follicularis]